MRRLIMAVALVTVVLVVPTAPVTATAPAKARASVVSFRLAPPNTAVAPTRGKMATAGDSIRVTGGGTVTVGGPVDAKGGFVHYNADGTVHCKGWWKATGVTGWTDFGGSQNRRHGRHGGVLSLIVTHYCTTMREVHTGSPMTGTSTLNAPPGSAYIEGTTVAGFTVPTGGGVSIWARRQLPSH